MAKHRKTRFTNNDYPSVGVVSSLKCAKGSDGEKYPRVALRREPLKNEGWVRLAEKHSIGNEGYLKYLKNKLGLYKTPSFLNFLWKYYTILYYTTLYVYIYILCVSTYSMF